MTDSKETEDLDIYSDLPNFQYDETIKKLERKNKDLESELKNLKKKIDALSKRNEHLESENKILGSNISSLYKTATNELQRKSNMIAELRREKDSILFRRDKKQSRGPDFNIPQEQEVQTKYSLCQSGESEYEQHEDEEWAKDEEYEKWQNEARTTNLHPGGNDIVNIPETIFSARRQGKLLSETLKNSVLKQCIDTVVPVEESAQTLSSQRDIVEGEQISKDDKVVDRSKIYSIQSKLLLISSTSSVPIHTERTAHSVKQPSKLMTSNPSDLHKKDCSKLKSRIIGCSNQKSKSPYSSENSQSPNRRLLQRSTSTNIKFVNNLKSKYSRSRHERNKSRTPVRSVVTEIRSHKSKHKQHASPFLDKSSHSESRTRSELKSTHIKSENEPLSKHLHVKLRDGQTNHGSESKPDDELKHVEDSTFEIVNDVLQTVNGRNTRHSGVHEHKNYDCIQKESELKSDSEIRTKFFNPGTSNTEAQNLISHNIDKAQESRSEPSETKDATGTTSYLEQKSVEVQSPSLSSSASKTPGGDFMSVTQTPPNKVCFSQTSPTYQDPATFKDGRVSISFFNEHCDFKRTGKRRSNVRYNFGNSNTSLVEGKECTDSSSNISENTKISNESVQKISKKRALEKRNAIPKNKKAKLNCDDITDFSSLSTDDASKTHVREFHQTAASNCLVGTGSQNSNLDKKIKRSETNETARKGNFINHPPERKTKSVESSNISRRSSASEHHVSSGSQKSGSEEFPEISESARGKSMNNDHHPISTNEHENRSTVLCKNTNRLTKNDINRDTAKDIDDENLEDGEIVDNEDVQVNLASTDRKKIFKYDKGSKYKTRARRVERSSSKLRERSKVLPSRRLDSSIHKSVGRSSDMWRKESRNHSRTLLFRRSTTPSLRRLSSGCERRSPSELLQGRKRMQRTTQQADSRCVLDQERTVRSRNTGYKMTSKVQKSDSEKKTIGNVKSSAKSNCPKSEKGVKRRPTKDSEQELCNKRMGVRKENKHSCVVNSKDKMNHRELVQKEKEHTKSRKEMVNRCDASIKIQTPTNEMGTPVEQRCSTFDCVNDNAQPPVDKTHEKESTTEKGTQHETEMCRDASVPSSAVLNDLTLDNRSSILDINHKEKKQDTHVETNSQNIATKDNSNHLHTLQQENTGNDDFQVSSQLFGKPFNSSLLSENINTMKDSSTLQTSKIEANPKIMKSTESMPSMGRFIIKKRRSRPCVLADSETRIVSIKSTISPIKSVDNTVNRTLNMESSDNSGSRFNNKISVDDSFGIGKRRANRALRNKGILRTTENDVTCVSNRSSENFNSNMPCKADRVFEQAGSSSDSDHSLSKSHNASKGYVATPQDFRQKYATVFEICSQESNVTSDEEEEEDEQFSTSSSSSISDQDSDTTYNPKGQRRRRAKTKKKVVKRSKTKKK